MKYKVTHYANFDNYYVVVFEINGYYVYVMTFKDNKDDFYPVKVSKPTKDFGVISGRFNPIPYSKDQEYGNLINNLITISENQLVSKYSEIVDEINFYIEKEMKNLNML